MSLARQDLLFRLDTLAACLNEKNLSDGAPSEYVRNQIAGLMRQGLAVLAFTALESFIRMRTAEALRSFDPAVVSFSNLSEAIQDAATLGAARGLLFRIKFEDPANQLAWALTQLKAVAASDTSLELSHLAFGNGTANLDEEDIPKILKAFGIDKPWINITGVAKNAGFGGLLDARQQFIEIKKRRHSSAHEITSSVPHGDLSNSLQSIRGIAVGFDLLLSHAVSLHNVGRFPGKVPEPKVEATHIKFLFIEELINLPGNFQVFRMHAASQSIPAARVKLNSFPTELEALTYAVETAKRSQEQAIAVGSGGVVADWHTW